MPKLIRKAANGSVRIVDEGDETLHRTYFGLVHLKPGESHRSRLPHFETVHVVQSGTADIRVDGCAFEAVGSRADIWSGVADSVYAPAGAEVVIEATHGPVDVAIAGGLADTDHAPFRIPPQDVAVVEVGSADTHSRRRIFHILGQNAHGRAGNLLVSELYADDGCWSGYPPHKHDTDVAAAETAHEELYHFRYDPPTGFGAQLTYEGDADGPSDCFLVRDGDTVLVDRGYHPTVASPGHRAYVFTILVGHTRRGLLQYFDPTHAHLMDRIPGLQAMRDRFR